MNERDKSLRNGLRRLNRYHRRQILKLALVRALWLGLLLTALIEFGAILPETNENRATNEIQNFA